MKTSEFVLVSYKQCIKTLESSSANVSPAELSHVCQKCNEALTCSRRIHSLIQLKYNEARTRSSQQPVISPTSPSLSCTQAKRQTDPLSTRSVSAAELLHLTCS